MARGFETGSDNERIDELQKQLDDVLDSQISSVGGNENISIDSSRGARNAASGDSGGIRSNQPIIHQITDVDEGGTPTGVFDKINIISSMAIIDHTATPITLRFIQGTIKDGARIKITPKIGKTINVESGGNILTSSTITITDTDYYELVKYSEAETGVTGGAFKILLIGTGGGGSSNVPDPTAEFQHLQSDDSNNWIAQQELEFGALSADSGQIRIPNDSIGISWRNVANDGNIEIKTTSTDILDITNSANDAVVLSLRAQDAIDLDISSSWTQLPNVGGFGGTTTFSYPTEFAFNHGATLVALFDSTDEINFFGVVDLNDNDIIKVDRLQLSGGTTSATSVNDVVWYISSDGDLISNINAGDSWGWSSGNIIKMILSDSTLEKRNVTAPSFQLYNTRAFQAGTAGTISILANSENSSIGVTMGFIIADTEVAAGDARGSLKVGVNLDGVLTLFLTMNEGNDEQLDILKETDFNAQDVLGINRLQLSGGTTSATSVNDVVWYLDAAGDLVSNINAGDGWLWSSGNIIKMILSDSTLEKRNVTAPVFQLYNTRAAQTGTAGTINILANSADISTGIPMAFILADTEVITGDGTGSMKLGVNLAGIPTSFIEINDSNDGNVKLQTNLDLGANFMQLTEIALPTNPAADNGLIYLRDVAGTTTPFFLNSSGTETSLIGAGGGSQTPWLSDIDADVFSLIDLGRTEYATGLFGASTDPFEVYDGTNLRWHVPTSGGFVWTIGAFDQIIGLGPSIVNVFKELDMQNANKIVNVNDPTADQDVVTRKFLEDNPSIPSGVQDTRIWTDHETAEFDFEVWHTNNKNGDLGSSVPLADDTAFYIPIWVGNNVTLREIGIDVTVAGAATVTLAIYDSEPTQNYPRTRIDFDSSTNGISVGTGIRTLTFFEALVPGLYWLLVRTDTGISIRQWNPDGAVSVGHFPAGGVTGAMGPISGYFDDLTSSTPDATADNDMSVLNGNTQAGIPAIYARFD